MLAPLKTATTAFLLSTNKRHISPPFGLNPKKLLCKPPDNINEQPLNDVPSDFIWKEIKRKGYVHYPLPDNIHNKIIELKQSKSTTLLSENDIHCVISELDKFMNDLLQGVFEKSKYTIKYNSPRLVNSKRNGPKWHKDMATKDIPIPLNKRILTYSVAFDGIPTVIIPIIFNDKFEEYDGEKQYGVNVFSILKDGIKPSSIEVDFGPIEKGKSYVSIWLAGAAIEVLEEIDDATIHSWPFRREFLSESLKKGFHEGKYYMRPALIGYIDINEEKDLN